VSPEIDWISLSLWAIVAGVFLVVVAEAVWSLHHDYGEWLVVPALLVLLTGVGLTGGGVGYVMVQAFHLAVALIWPAA
jgi:fatty acid desaturase